MNSAGGQKWHASCFKCSMCNKMLDSTNNNAKDNVLYCKVRVVSSNFVSSAVREFQPVVQGQEKFLDLG